MPATPMAASTHPHRTSRSLSQQLRTLAHWLLDAAGSGLGFQGPKDHPSPPNVGVQPFSGGDSHRRSRRQRSY
ncbi:MAG: hypothetical protein FJ060_05195 [Cyanobacteria bacterium K_Offshore_0m_m2_072]|nr:hypothetical protein [Cyanobacteria bacterium K_Offshore_0m_m2_072]